MKGLYLTLLALVLLVIVMMLQSCQPINDYVNQNMQGDSLISKIAIALLALYEVIVRIIPSVADLSLISWFIRFLKWLSDGLNRKPVN